MAQAFDEVVNLQNRAQPAAGQWLAEQGSLPRQSSIAKRGFDRLLYTIRKRRFDRFFESTSTEK
jgi:hypothetical protein